MSRRAAERGSATVLGVGVVGVLAAVMVLVAVLAGAVADQRRVESAADLGALAGAAAVQQGRPACASARDVVSRNGATLTSCTVAGEAVEVSARRRTQPLLGHRFEAASTARAGPVS
jgi:secretion/DNA translocation related TadE-like protein